VITGDIRRYIEIVNSFTRQQGRPEMDSPLIREFDYYLAHQDELVRQYNGRFIVIKDHAVLGSYDDQLQAITETAKNHEIGTFLVQKVEPGPGAYTQTFHSRVTFAP
jgi:hypothetical protein